MTASDPPGDQSGPISGMGLNREGYDAEIVSAADELFRENYDELLRVARSLRRRRSHPSETLNTTALVHEAFLRLRKSGRFQDDHHFFCSAALAIRHTLIDHARRSQRPSTPRAAGDQIEQLQEDQGGGEDLSPEDIMSVRQGLEFVADHDPRLVRMIDCRFYAGLSTEETAIVLGLTERTVRRDWVKARALLRMHLGANSTRSLENDRLS